MATKQATLTDTDEEPWKDAKILHDLYHEEDLNQSEIADKLGTTASTISYWMDKLEVDTTHTQHSEEQEENLTSKCEYYEVCGNNAPGPRNGLCEECLDYARANNSRLDAGKNCIDRRKYDDMTEFMADLRKNWTINGLTLVRRE